MDLHLTTTATYRSKDGVLSMTIKGSLFNTTTAREGKENDMATGYELMLRADALVAELVASEGETNELIEAALAQLEDDIKLKMDGYRYYIEGFTSKAARLRAQAKRMSAMAQQCEREAKNLKDRAAVVMEAQVDLHGWDKASKVSCENGVVYLSRRQRVKIPDEAAFLEANSDQPWVKLEPKINRSAVGKAMLGSDPISVEGAVVDDYTTITFK